MPCRRPGPGEGPGCSGGVVCHVLRCPHRAGRRDRCRLSMAIGFSRGRAATSVSSDRTSSAEDATSAESDHLSSGIRARSAYATETGDRHHTPTGSLPTCCQPIFRDPGRAFSRVALNACATPCSRKGSTILSKSLTQPYPQAHDPIPIDRTPRRGTPERIGLVLLWKTALQHRQKAPDPCGGSFSDPRRVYITTLDLNGFCTALRAARRLPWRDRRRLRLERDGIIPRSDGRGSSNDPPRAPTSSRFAAKAHEHNLGWLRSGSRPQRGRGTDARQDKRGRLARTR